MPANDSFAETPELIRWRAKRFEIAMWSYLATMSLGLVYALFTGSSFFPALRHAEFQYPELDQAGNFAGIVPFVNGVISTWPERLAAHPATRVELVSILLAFILGIAAFRAVWRSPKGELLEARFLDERPRQRMQRAFELAGSNVSLFKRTDRGDAAEYSSKRNGIYLPADFMQNLYRKLSDSAPEQLAFLIVHEKMHGSTSDNFLWSWGRSLAFLLTAISATLIATPIMMAAAAAVPASLVIILPFPLSLGLTLLFSAVLVALIGAVNHGVLPNLVAVREFFADAFSARTLMISLESLPYEGTTVPASRGDMASGWSMNTSGPDRRLHVKGIAPRTGALAASTLAMWILVRTLILMLDPTARYAIMWVFDAACVIEVAAMLGNLPHRCAGTRDYGSLPWTATVILMGLIAVSFVLIDKVFSGYGVASIIPSSWLVAIAVPPVVVMAAVLSYRRAARGQRNDIEEIDRLPPRRIGIRPLVQLAAAMPSYVWSYTMAGVALFTWCRTLASWGVGDLSSAQPYFMLNVVPLSVCALFGILAVKNFREPCPWSVACEACCGVVVFALLFYSIMNMIGAAALTSSGDSGLPFDMDLFIQLWISPEPSTVMTTLVTTAVFGLVLLGSWEIRYRFLNHESLLASLRHAGHRPRSLSPVR